MCPALESVEWEYMRTRSWDICRQEGKLEEKKQSKGCKENYINVKHKNPGDACEGMMNIFCKDKPSPNLIESLLLFYIANPQKAHF